MSNLMIKKNYKNKNLNYKNTRFCIVSFIQIILFVIFLTLLLISHSETNFSASLKLTSLNVQEMRAYSLFLGYAFFVISLIILFNAHQQFSISNIEKKLLYFSILPFITIFNFFYFLYKAKNDNNIKEYFKHIWLPTNAKEVNYQYFFKNLKLFFSKDLLFWNTFLSLFLLLITSISFIFICLPPNLKDNTINPFNLWTFDKASYFTEWTNFMCFVFAFSFFINHRSKIFNNNIFLLVLNAYIMFVLVIFWFVLIPGSLIVNQDQKFDFKKISVNEIIFTIWFHAITPITFFIFTIFYLRNSKKKYSLNYWKYFKIAFPYLFLYMLYAYTLPFIADVTIYSYLTNSNPNNDAFSGQIFGSFYVFFIPILALFLFSGWLHIFFRLGKKISLRQNIF